IDVAYVVNSCFTIVKESAANAGLTLRTGLPDDLPSLYADKRSLRQILLNLLSNSIKFTPSGGSVMVEAGIEADGKLAVIVRDTGIGMSADDIEIVLQPFGQVESAHTRSHNGTGLGLPISKSLAGLHGGSMVVESKVGKGTDITVRFPAPRVGGASLAADSITRRSA